ncbi:hypothetical protein [Brevibacillus parabrevis]|uniref:hypothetical protein n=1 Tax=Brevibacillus parabrevis TaxID=54914 RepID=UPI001F60747E|nr:hypothetical protein [Brevibacillus parabrevis]
MILANYDVSGIQEYIFQSRRMKENIGASRIVGDVLKVHLPDILKQQYPDDAGQRVICNWSGQPFSLQANQAVMIEVIYVGGGNAFVAFRDVDDFHAVNEQLAKRLLERSRTLYLAVAAVESNGQSFIEDKQRLVRRMAKVKAQMLRPQPPGAFPVSEQENQSGLPITDFSEGVKQNVSRLQWLKLEAIPKGNAQEIVPFPSNVVGYKNWTLELDHMIQGRDTDSFIAIIHIDGNGMGEQLKQKEKEIKRKNLPYSGEVQAMRRLSEQISSGYSEVFEQATISLMEAQHSESGSPKSHYLPMRPLIMDGDDLTIVCLGAWGVPFAARMLEELEKASRDVPSDGISLSACAGVALMHSHFPFNLGYEVAEACCKRAKRKRADEGGSHAYLDFEMVRDSIPQNSNREQLQAGPYRISFGAENLLAQMASSRKQRLDDFSILAKCIARITESKWPNWRLEKLYSALLGNSEQLRFYLQECRSRGYEVDMLLPVDEVGCLDNKQQDIPIDVRKLLLDALDLYQMFDQKVWTCGKGGAE